MAYQTDKNSQIEDIFKRRHDMKSFFEESEKVDNIKGVKYTCPIWKDCKIIKEILGEINTTLGIYKYPLRDPSEVDMDLCTGASEPLFHCCSLYGLQTKVMENSIIRIEKEIVKVKVEREDLRQFNIFLDRELMEAWLKARERGTWRDE